MAPHTDVLIIGSGIIGSAVAYYLAKKGARVMVLDKKGMAGGTSSACDGFVFLQSKSPGIHLEMAMNSACIYKNLGQELGCDVEYKASGGLILIETPEELRIMEEIVKRQKESGLKIDLIDGDEARKREPLLSEKAVAASFCSGDGHVNPIKTVFAYSQAAQRLGARFLYHTPVQAIKTRSKRVFSVITEKQEIRATWVVNACGVWAPQIGEMVGLKIPITPRRGQILVSEPLAPLFNHVILCANYIAVKHKPSRYKNKPGVGLSLEQTANGNILVGSSREFAGFNTGLSLQAACAIAGRASRFFPCLKDAKIIRAFVGLRPYTADGLPILGPVRGLGGFIMAAGHEGDGIALAPITGRLIAGHILEGRSAFPLKEFSLSRFSA